MSTSVKSVFTKGVDEGLVRLYNALIVILLISNSKFNESSLT